MTFHEYVEGREIAGSNYPFYALIQAAMRQADSDNIELLKSVFPAVYEELLTRYNTPGGRLAGEG